MNLLPFGEMMLIVVPALHGGTRMNQGSRWRCIFVKSQAEWKATNNIVGLGFPGFCPFFIQDATAKRVETRKPLFPGYVFAKFDTDDGGDYWWPIKRTDGVIGILGPRDKPTALSDRFIEGLQAIERETGGYQTKVQEMAKTFNQGDKVRVTQQMYENLTGIYDQSQGDRIKVLIDILGTESPVWLDEKFVEPLVAA